MGGLWEHHLLLHPTFNLTIITSRQYHFKFDLLVKTMTTQILTIKSKHYLIFTFWSNHDDSDLTIKSKI